MLRTLGAYVILMLLIGGVGFSLPRAVTALVAPTLVDYDQSDWSDNLGIDEVTGSISWQAGDVIVVLGSVENGGAQAIGLLETPTATGLTFATTTSIGWGDVSTTFNAAWTATAGSSGSGVVTSAAAGPGEFAGRGIAVFVYRGSNGIGNSATVSAAAGETINLTRSSDNSVVVWVLGDWDATNDTAVDPTPSSGATQRVAQWISGQATFFVYDWTDQGAAGGPTAYGITNYDGGRNSGVVVEIKGSEAPAGGRVIRLKGGLRFVGGVRLGGSSPTP